MAYNFLSLVNDVNGRLNEVPLTESNFVSAGGFYHQAKESVNSALRDIYQDAFEWPFTHRTQELVLTPFQNRYDYPEDVKSINYDTFRIKRDMSLNADTQKLYQLDYEEYLNKLGGADYNAAHHQGVPNIVFRTPGLSFGVYPSPKDAYTLVYEYYVLPLDLVNPTDVPLLPPQLRHIIVDGATHYSYMFRGDPESAAVMLQKFQQGIKNARKIYQNRFEYVYAGAIPNNSRIW